MLLYIFAHKLVCSDINPFIAAYFFIFIWGEGGGNNLYSCEHMLSSPTHWTSIHLDDHILFSA